MGNKTLTKEIQKNILLQTILIIKTSFLKSDRLEDNKEKARNNLWSLRKLFKNTGLKTLYQNCRSFLRKKDISKKILEKRK